jgi:hypothetical protein
VAANGDLDAALDRCLRDVAVAAADLALYCDRTEHAEPVSTALICRAGATLRRSARMCADVLGIDLLASYAARLAVVEARGASHLVAGFDGAAAARAARTWTELQGVQAQHDRDYHPDVIGLARADQVRHCALHTAKLAGSVAQLRDDSSALDEFSASRVPDMLIFGLKLADLAREVLPRVPFDETTGEVSITAVVGMSADPSGAASNPWGTTRRMRNRRDPFERSCGD